MFADSCEIKYKKIGSTFVFIWGFLHLVCLVVFYFSHFITKKTAFSNSITKYLHFFTLIMCRINPLCLFYIKLFTIY